MNTEENSYRLHEKHFDQYGKGGARAQIAQGWFQQDTIDAQQALTRHRISDPMLEAYPGADWVTVGDGRYGADAHYLSTRGANALATDIADTLLIEGKEMGLIAAYSKENAEALSFEDLSFDFVLCKESYHHFPRPIKALYEMLRVSRKGVILLEPADPYVYENVLQALFRGLLLALNATGIFKILLGRSVKKHTYEEVGNYVYKVSVREMEKIALGLNYPCLAWKSVNIFHAPGTDKVSATRFSMKRLYVQIMTGLLNLLSSLRIAPPQLYSIIIWKEMPNEACIAALKKAGYRLNKLPRNPYWG